MLNIWICTYLQRPDRGLDQWFPKFAARIPWDQRPVPRESVDAILLGLLRSKGIKGIMFC